MSLVETGLCHLLIGYQSVAHTTADIFIPFSPDGRILWSRIKSREQIMSIFIDQALAYSQAEPFVERAVGMVVITVNH